MQNLPSHEQQQPTSFSKRYTFPCPSEQVEEDLPELLRGFIKEMNEWSRANGGMVGHIKILSDCRHKTWISSTGGMVEERSVGVKADIPASLTLYVTAIVFNVPSDLFCMACEDTLKPSISLLCGGRTAID